MVMRQPSSAPLVALLLLVALGAGVLAFISHSADKPAAAVEPVDLQIPAATTIVVFVALWLYFLPTIVAMGRGHPNAAPIFVVNLVFGWTLLGFVAALAWSLTAIDRNRNYR
jgi:hypothetical protein